MKRTRLLVLGVTTVGLLGLQQVPFAAADTTTVIRSMSDFPVLDPYVGIVDQSCDPATAGAAAGDVPAFPVVEKGPAPVPLGTRTWGYRPTQPGAIGPYLQVDSMAGVAADQMQVYGDGGTIDGAATARVVDDQGNAWYGVAPLTVTGGSWQTVHGDGDTSYTWRAENYAGTTVDSFTGTIHELLAHLGGDDRPGTIGLGFGCDGTGEFHFDDVRMGTTGDVTTFDYEGDHPSSISIAATPATVRAGRATTISGTVMWLGDGETDDAILQRRAFGSSTWRAARRVTVAQPLACRVKPIRETSFRWVYPGNEISDGARSQAITVEVHTAVRAHVPDRVALGSTVHVTGSTLPRKPGQRITLWRGNHLLDATQVGRKGGFSLATRATYRGKLNLVVKIGRTPGNLRGHRVWTVRVH